MATIRRRNNLISVKYFVFLLYLWTFICNTGAQEDLDPCENDKAIILPRSKTCLVYNNRAKNWIEAAQECERDGGRLYEIKNGLLKIDKDVGDCLAFHPKATEDMNFWIGATGKWSPQWYWVNGSHLNPLLSCAHNTSGLTVRTSEFCSKYLSVDYCVGNCRSDGTEFCVVQHDKTNPCYWCSYTSAEFSSPCPSGGFKYGQGNNVWIFHTFSKSKSTGILLDTAEVLTTSETLCGVIDKKTTVRRELSSEPCFTKNPYICNLGHNYKLCNFYVSDDCMWIGVEKLSWVEARAECQLRGGDLVIAFKNFDTEFEPYIKESHWVGASNYYWNFQPLSNVFGDSPDYQTVSCGHMHSERGIRDWDWSDGTCDTTKPFVCQHVPKFEVDSSDSFRCPWPLNIVPTGTLPNKTVVPLPSIVSTAGTTFPLAAIIAASIMALLILTCAILTIGFSRRKKRFVSNMRKSMKTDGIFAITKAPKHYYHLWNSPYSYYSDRKSDNDVDSLSTIHTGVFNDGSILSVPGYGFDEHGRQVYTLVDGDHLYGKIHRTHSERSNVIQAHVLSNPIAEEEENEETEVKTNLSDMSAIHSTNSVNRKEYMTLAAMMNFGDEFFSGKSTLRNRPEVALVTSDVDLNFTVNHALPKKRTFSDTTERSLEEIELPRGTTVELPTKLRQEEDILY